MNRDIDQSLDEEKQQPPRARWQQRLSRAHQYLTRWGRHHVRPGWRSVLGILFLVGGIFGFLPILGFWMIPLGVSLLALDFLWMRRRLDRWRGRDKETQEKTTTARSETREACDHAPRHHDSVGE